MFWDLGPKSHSHQSGFLQQASVFEVNQGTPYGKYIQVTQRNTTLPTLIIPVITEMIGLQTMAHICELHEATQGNWTCIFIDVLWPNPKYFMRIS